MLRLPFLQARRAEGRAGPRHEGRCPQRRSAGTGRRARQAGRQQTARSAHLRQRASADAAEREARGSNHRGLRTLDRRRRTRSSNGNRAAAGPGKRVVGESELAKGRQWWAFQAVRELPTDALRAMAGKGIDDKLVASHEVRVRSKLDRFVLAKLAEKGLTPSPEADARTLIRRAYIDLIGLKPTYEEVEAYAARPLAGRLRKTGGPAARFAAVRRAVGALLARRRPLRRGQPRELTNPRIPTPGATATG